MKRIKSALLLITSLAITINSCRKDIEEQVAGNNPVAQNNQPGAEGNVCGAIEYTDPATKSRMETMDRMVQAYITQKAKGGLRPTSTSVNVVTVPIVFHVIYNLPVQNISDAQLQSQIAVFNLDYSAANTDIGNVPACFQPLIGNAGFQFVLAQRDPNGNATNGIIRKSTTVTSFSSDGSVCFDSLGGDNAWPSSQYLNIWICNKSGAAGFSSYPWSGSPSTDGIITGYNYVGTTGTFTNNWDYLLGRTLTHEVGHWFGLIHTWGDAVCGDDLVGDTPTQEAANGACPTFPHMSSCSPNSNGDMYMNYMDYTYDACRIMFSAGQVTRMLGYLNTTRAGILTSLGGVSPNGTVTCNVPSGLAASSVAVSSALLNWASTGASSYSVMYQASGSSTWTSITSSTNSLSISGLAASTAYVFKVQSVCSGSSSAFSPATSFATLAPACNVPIGLTTSSVTTNSAILNWASTGASSYSVIYQASGSGTWTSASSSTNSLNISGLATSTAYVFKLQSVCSGSSSSYSTTASFTTLATACGVPTGLTASSVTTNSAALNWVSTGASSYSIMYQTSGSVTWTSASSSTNSLNISGLAGSTAYVFKVQSVCSGSSSAYSSAKSFTTLATACNIPNGLSASSITRSGAILNWASTGASSYNIIFKPSVATSWTGASSTTNSFSLSGLASATSYDFEVQSVCSGSSSGYTPAVSFNTLAPPCNVPTGLSASSITTNSTILNWASTGASSYNVTYQTSGSSSWTSASSSINSLTISGLAASTSYVFEVQSICSGISSAYSSSISFLTLAPPCNTPSGLSTSVVNSSSANLSWSATGALSYNVMYKSTSSSTWIIVSTSATTLNISGLSGSTTYEFQVQSVCSGNTSSYSSYSTFTTPNRHGKT